MAAKRNVKKVDKEEISAKKIIKKQAKESTAEKSKTISKSNDDENKKTAVKSAAKPKKSLIKKETDENKKVTKSAVRKTAPKKTALKKKQDIQQDIKNEKVENINAVNDKVINAAQNHNIEIKEIEIDELMIEAAKFYTPAISKAAQKKVQVSSDAMNEGELPERYFDNKLVLMARDPYWCYAYWDISPELMEKAHNEAGGSGAILTLRVYDITGINFDGKNALKFVDITVSGEANNWYINVWEAGRKYVLDLGYKKYDGTFVVIKRSNPVTTPKDTVSNVIDEEWMTVDEDFDEIFRMSGGGTKPASGSERFPLSLEEHLSSFSVSSFGSASLQGATESGGQQAGKKRGFWLVADTELILYGATERDAKVRVKGEPVKLEADGSFSLRFHLPDGVMHLPVEAVSNDGVDKITLKFTVERQSK